MVIMIPGPLTGGADGVTTPDGEGNNPPPRSRRKGERPPPSLDQ